MSEDTFIQEVHEELRRDRLRDGWRRYGAYVIGAAVVIVLAVAANEGWSWYQGSNAARSSDQFFAALDIENGGDLAGAQKALDGVIADGSGQYPVLAKFKAAGLLARQGKKDEALAAYDSLATSEGNARLKGLALLLGANILVDKGDVPGVKSRIQGLMTPDDPLHNSAEETLGLAQYKAGDLNAARDSFEAVIADPLSPDEARGRMQLFISQLVAQGATPPASETTATSAGAAAVQAIGAATGGSAGPVAVSPPANDNGAAPATTDTQSPPVTDDTTPVGVESAQPSTPDAALDMAAPAPPATAPEAAPMLSTGAGLPTMSTDAAPTDTTSAAPSAGDTTAPVNGSTAAPASDSTPAAAPAATVAPDTTPAPAAAAATSPAPATTPAPDATTTPAAAPAAGTTGQ